MIHDSSYWKDDLLKLAQRLERRILQTRWGDKNFYTLENEIFVGFFLVRKLIESKKVSRSVAKKAHRLKEFGYTGDPLSLVTHMRESEYDLSTGTNTSMSVHDLCNQFIHSHHFVPFFVTGRVIGFFFCSDRRRTSGIYLITLLEVVEIYRAVGSNQPSSMSTKHLKNGKVVMIVE